MEQRKYFRFFTQSITSDRWGVEADSAQDALARYYRGEHRHEKEYGCDNTELVRIEDQDGNEVSIETLDHFAAMDSESSSAAQDATQGASLTASEAIGLEDDARIGGTGLAPE